MASIGLNIASSSGAGSSEGSLALAKVSLTLEEHLENFQRILCKGLNFDYCEYHLDIAFFQSVAKVVNKLRSNPLEDIERLLSRVWDPNRLLHGTTPLHWAVLMDDRTMVYYILRSEKVDINAATTEFSNTALFYAVIGGNHEIVEDLLNHNADVGICSQYHESTLSYMVSPKNSMFGILKKILHKNINKCDDEKKTALHYAAREGDVDVVAYLLNKEANVHLQDCWGYTPLHYATKKGSLDVVTHLLNEKADVNLQENWGYTPLHCAAKSGSLDVVTHLLQQNANVNAISKNGKSPLHIAAREGATNIVSLLIEHNAIVDVLDKYGWSPLLYALKYEKVDASIALIEAHANVNVHDKDDNNALHLAIWAHKKGHNITHIVKLHQELDVNANAKNSKGYTPFFVAVIKGHTDVVEELFKRKDKIKLMEECNGQTAIQIAFDYGHEHIKRLLLEDDAVSRYVETQYRDRQVYVDAANAILVGAALIASVTFASWLQPPLGYTTSYLDLVPSSSNINYVDVQHNVSLRVFWVFNTLSFYFAIGTVVFGARSVLPRQQIFIKEIVDKLHRNLLITSILLACSVFCVLVAFGIAGSIVLTPTLKFQWYMIVPTVFGGLVCLVSLGFLFKSMVEDNLEKKRKALGNVI